MRKRMMAKLKSQAGESLGETMVSLLIAALALVMLAGAISAASEVIIRSRNKLDDYYSENEKATGVVKMADPGGAGSGEIVLQPQETTESFTWAPFPVVYYENDQFGKTPVIAYKLS